VDPALRSNHAAEAPLSPATRTLHCTESLTESDRTSLFSKRPCALFQFTDSRVVQIFTVSPSKHSSEENKPQDQIRRGNTTILQVPPPVNRSFTDTSMCQHYLRFYFPVDFPIFSPGLERWLSGSSVLTKTIKRRGLGQ
jgi:hypothetical protein